MIDTNITESSSFEELLLGMMDSSKLTQEEMKSNNLKVYPIAQQVFAEVWEMFTRNFRSLCEWDPRKERTEQEAVDAEKEIILWKKEMRSAIQILRIVSNRQKGNWNLKLESFKSTHYLLPLYLPHSPLNISSDILVYYKKNISKVDWVIVKELAAIAEQVKKQENLELIKQIVQILSILLIRSHGTEDSEWFISCE